MKASTSDVLDASTAQRAREAWARALDALEALRGSDEVEDYMLDTIAGRGAFLLRALERSEARAAERLSLPSLPELAKPSKAFTLAADLVSAFCDIAINAAEPGWLS